MVTSLWQHNWVAKPQININKLEQVVMKESGSPVILVGRWLVEPEVLQASLHEPWTPAVKSCAFRKTWHMFDSACVYRRCFWVWKCFCLLLSAATFQTRSLCGCQLGGWGVLGWVGLRSSLSHFQNDFHCSIRAFGGMQHASCQEKENK